MPRLFDRRAAVTVNTTRFESDPSPDFAREVGFRIAFKVERSIASDSNKATAQVWNLNETSRGLITVPSPAFILEAGYLDTVATIFKGKAQSVITTRESVGVVTEVTAKDGFKEVRNRVNKAEPPGVKAVDVVETLTKAIKLPAKQALSKLKSGDIVAAGKILLNGISLTGDSKSELDKLAKSMGFDWSIQNEEIQILFPDQTTDEDAILLTPFTGLIASPVRVIDKERPKKVIVRGRSLLQPGISPGRQLELESVEVSGVFKCQKVSHSGDTQSGEFFSEFEAVEFDG